MPASQQNPLDYNPNGLDFTEIACYKRTIDAPIERVWENVLDWEHLPHLHDESFEFAALVEAGDWGWRVLSRPDGSGHIELCVDETSYVARSYADGEQFSEIWTTLTPEGNRTTIDVRFFAVVDAGAVAKVGAIYTKLYTRLWDEDEGMMQARQRRLDEQAEPGPATLDLGEARDASFPMTVRLGRREYRLTGEAGTVTATPTICPHLLGPLEDVTGQPGVLRCPWHGYEFERASGACINRDHATCRLPPTPTFETVDGRLILRA